MIRLRRASGWLAGLLLLAGTGTPAFAQVTLYVSFGASLNAYNAANGAFLAQFSNSLSNPWTFAIDGSGRLYSSLYTGDTVAVFQTQPGGGGSTVSTAFLNPGVYYPTGIAVSGNNLFLASQQGQKIGLYDATTGATLNASFISGVYNPTYLALDGNGRLFVTNNNSEVSVFNAATGAPVSPHFITGLSGPMGLALDANNRLYVASVNGNSVGVYDATTGALINSSLIAGLNSPRALAIDPAGNLYVSSFASGTYRVGVYNALTGAALNPTLLVTGSSIGGLGFAAVPEPATWASLLAGLALLAIAASRRR